MSFLRLSKVHRPRRSLAQILAQLDLLGTALFVPGIVCLLLALQWGGVYYAWANVRIVVLFVLFGLIMLAFVALQIVLKDRATVPVRIAAQRTIAFASFFSLCNGAAFFVFVYFMPIWVSRQDCVELIVTTTDRSQFQAIKGVNAVSSGVYILPLILANVAGTILSGGIVSKFGYYGPFFLASSVLMSIGAGLCTLLKVDSSQARWAGFQFIFGLGVGLGFQQPSLAAQAALEMQDVPIGTAIMTFMQVLGGALFIAVAQNVFTSRLVEYVLALNIPGLDPQSIIRTGATGLRTAFDDSRLPGILQAYNRAVVKTLQVGLVLSCLCLLGSVGIEWKNIRKKPAARSAQA